MSTKQIFKLRMELLDYKPPIWREVQVLRNIPLSRLAYIIMILFEMKASHLFNFEQEILGKIVDYILIDEFTEDFEIRPTFDATTTKLYQVLTKKGDKINFTYDYGDNWEIKIVLKEIIIDNSSDSKEFPKVIDGNGYGIIEDCGGAYGLHEIAKAFKRKSGKDYKDYCDWLGVNDLDLTKFDIEDMNFRLKKVPRIYKGIYERHQYPTKQSLKILKREYKIK